jgi:uncharacterized RDD family membrane protein YckC
MALVRCPACNTEQGGSLLICRSCGTSLIGVERFDGSASSVGSAESTPGSSLDQRQSAQPVADSGGVTDGVVRGVSPSSQYAVGKDFWPRAIAYLLDLVISNLAALAIMGAIAFLVIFGVAIRTGRQFTFDPDLMRIPSYIASLLISVMYFALCEWLHGASLGKLLLRMRVVRTDGSPCSFGSALIRSCMRLFDGLLFGVPAYVSMKFPTYQRLGDKWADTFVLTSTDPFIKRRRSGWWMILALTLWMLAACVVLAAIELWALVPASRIPAM